MVRRVGKVLSFACICWLFGEDLTMHKTRQNNDFCAYTATHQKRCDHVIHAKLNCRKQKKV